MVYVSLRFENLTDRNNRMSRIIISILLIFTSLSHLYAQDKYTLSGHVKDKSSGEELIGATIYIEELKSGGVTNVYGFYSITIPEGNYNIKYSYIGYESERQYIELNKNLYRDIELGSQDATLSEVVIKGEADNENIR